MIWETKLELLIFSQKQQNKKKKSFSFVIRIECRRYLFDCPIKTYN